MPEGWNFYFCKVNDVLASVALDLDLRKQVPDLSRPELLWIWVYFKSPRPDGLSSSSEFDSLVAIEKQLTESLEQKFHALLCGRITTDGRREFYYARAGVGVLELEPATYEVIVTARGFPAPEESNRSERW